MLYSGTLPKQINIDGILDDDELVVVLSTHTIVLSSTPKMPEGKGLRGSFFFKVQPSRKKKSLCMVEKLFVKIFKKKRVLFGNKYIFRNII